MAKRGKTRGGRKRAQGARDTRNEEEPRKRQPAPEPASTPEPKPGQAPEPEPEPGTIPYNPPGPPPLPPAKGYDGID